ncbi:AAA domain-containing protein [Actinoplanes sp. DH11]|uniref:AAA domain-containing protein n=1 Tax=Actinoplanes sp. DH11 TaxID=2857011 RepID=UPI001E4CCA68|nr:AAA domain-containing protein [Actinoplanes sp. DH11]
MQPSTVLAVLAELAPATAERTLDVTRGSQALVWLDTAEKAPRKAATDRLAALDALHREERVLHRGWGFLAGTTMIDGRSRKVRFPLLSQPVRLERALTGYRVVPAGDLEITPLIGDRDLAAAMEAAPGLAAPGWLEAIGSRAWLRSAAEATGFPFDAMTDSGQRLPKDRLVLVAAAALYVARDVFGVGLSDSLRSWAGRDVSGTALAAVYGEHRADLPDDDEPVHSPLPLSDEQARVVARARTAPVTVVSGPPGSGKSHTVVAAALEVVQRGGSVLVATQSSHAAEVLAGLLSRYPGPVPVLFGDAAGRADLEAGLTAGAEQGASAERLRAGQDRVQAAISGVRAKRTVLTEALDLELRAAQLTDFEPLLPGLAVDVPGAFDDAVDLARIEEWRSREGWWARRRLRSKLRPRPGVPPERVTEALAAATAQRAAAHLAATGGTQLDPHWAALHEAEEALREAVGAAMRDSARSAKRWDRDARRAAGALAAALRAGRNRRRELLAQLDAPPLVRALPLWIGTVADVEDLLPPAPGLFDLVVIDEASHVDQIRAAPVLARARRALVVGDPRQLRFVSFVSDVDVTEVLTRHDVPADALDVRRVSTYDLAAAAAPVTWLGAHYRSVPHLIGFSADRFYGGRVSVMTRTPLSDMSPAIDVIPVSPSSSAPASADSAPASATATASAPVTASAASPAEVEAALRAVAELASAGYRGIGVITPFRAQAEALEAAFLSSMRLEQIEDLRLRVGTVHAFQGSEADAVVVSLALSDADSPSRRRFVTDPQLFNVMVTRARKRLVVLSALTSPDGLLKDFLEYAQSPPAPPPPPHEPAAAGPPSPEEPGSGSPSHVPPTSGSSFRRQPGAGSSFREQPAVGAPPLAEPKPEDRAAVLPAGWAAELSAELRRLDVPVRPGYRVGTWHVDLCVGPPSQVTGVLCGIHPDGPAAHLSRQTALHRAGWHLIDAFPSRWNHDPRRAALEIAAATSPSTPATPTAAAAPTATAAP